MDTQVLTIPSIRVEHDLQFGRRSGNPVTVAKSMPTRFNQMHHKNPHSMMAQPINSTFSHIEEAAIQLANYADKSYHEQH